MGNPGVIVMGYILKKLLVAKKHPDESGQVVFGGEGTVHPVKYGMLLCLWHYFTG
jgi:hypothetical protein